MLIMLYSLLIYSCMKKVVVLALLLFVCVGSLLAQENDKQKKKSITDSLFRIDQVDVMQKKKRIDLLGLDVPLRFVPITVSKLSSQMLDRKGIVDLMDAVKFLPGIVAKDKQYGQFQQFSIRGQGSAVVMIDGIRDERTLNNNVPYGDLAAVESIELLKGPAAILAGHSAMGGVLISRPTLVSVMVAGMRDGLLLVSGENSWDLSNIVPISIIQRVTDGVR